MKLAEISIKRPVFATVMIAVLVVFGLFSYTTIGVDQFPNTDIPVVTIVAVYPGADPETVEEKVVKPIEDAVATVSGIDALKATAMENVGFVTIQFKLERDGDKALQDVRDQMAGISSELPSDLDPPVVSKVDLGAMPIISLTVSGPLPIRELTDLADNKVRGRIESINGVGTIDLVGGREREVNVWIDPVKLSAHGLALTELIQILAAQNIEIPGGRIEVTGEERLIKTQGKVRDVRELEEIILSSAAGAPVLLKDVALVEDGFVEQRSYSAVNGESAVSLVIRKQSGANTVAVAADIHAAIDELAAELPDEVEIEVQADNSVFIKTSIHEAEIDLILGAALAIFIIMFFLHDWRATFISALALPTSVIATFAFIAVMDFTFNVVTMLALSLSIGILIDDAIVVIENIHRHLSMGKGALQAAADGTSEIGLAVLATTASIVAVFVPVAMMEGIVGRMLFQFGLTVAFAVSISLFVAFTLTPMLSSKLLVHHEENHKKLFIFRAIDWSLDRVIDVYRMFARLALRFRVLTLLAAIGLLVGALSLAGHIPVEFMPQEDKSEFQVSVELPAGTTLEETSAYAESIASQVREIPGVQSTFTTIGGGDMGEVQIASIRVNLVEPSERTYTQEEAIEHVRELLAGREEAIIAVEPIPMMSGQKTAEIQFNIRGPNFEELNTAADALIAKLEEAGGYVDLDKSYRGGKPEMQVSIDRQMASNLGIPIASIAMTIRSMFEGQKASELTQDDETIDVRVRLDEKYRQSPSDLKNFKMRSGRGALVNLESVLKVNPGQGEAKISRQNRQRQVTVLASLEGKALGDAVTEVESLAEEVVPAHLITDWDGNSKMLGETVNAIVKALLLAIILVYLILAAQFESFIHPFTIMMSLPLSLIGAFGALYLTQMQLGMFTMIGFIMLMGLVTKNAILLVDYALQLQREGVEVKESLVRAGAVRLRPILMTTAAMIFGMLPVALALSGGGQMKAPMATAIIGGLITSTVLTLVVVPVVFSLLDSIGRLLRRILPKKAKSQQQDALLVED